jgi:tetratricopeptide (TPR) repeat protein
MAKRRTNREKIDHRRSNESSAGPTFAFRAGGERGFDAAGFMAEQSRFMALVAEVMSKQEFASIEEAQEFLNTNMTGRPIEEIAREYRTDSPRDRALNLLDEIPRNCPPARARHQLRKALEIDPECLEALVAIAAIEPKLPGRAVAYERAIEVGRARFADEIESLEPGDGLWGYAPARPLLEAMQGLAYARRSQGRFGEAAGLFREILDLNPPDNQGVRDDLVDLFLALGQIGDSLALLDEYAGDPSCSWLYSRALALFLRALEETGFEPPYDAHDGGRALDELFENLPSEFAPANRALDAAIAGNPFVAWFIDVGPEVLACLESPPHYQLGSPDEAFLYATRTGDLWGIDERAFLWLIWRIERAAGAKAWRAGMSKHGEQFASYQELMALAGSRKSKRR